MRVIDADALLDAYEHIDWYSVSKTGGMTRGCTSSDNPVIHYYDGEEVIKNAPTIDAVPVVRCKDCKYGHDNCGDIACWHTKYDLLEGVLTHEKDFYCSYGERKEGAD